MEGLWEMVVEVTRLSDRVMVAVLDFEKEVFRLVCVYAMQSGRSLEEKQSFYDLR